MSGTVVETLERGASPEDLAAQTAKERLSSFYIVYVGLFLLILAYLVSVRVAEHALEGEFQGRIDRAITVRDFERPVVEQIMERVSRVVGESAWIEWGGLQVQTIVTARDGVTWLYVDGRSAPPPPGGLDSTEMLLEWMDLLPATAEVTVTLPHNALASNLILIAYSGVFLVVLYRSNRRLGGRESERLAQALENRDEAAQRTADIEAELADVRARLSTVEPIEREHSEEIESLQRERESLRRKFSELAAREETLRGRANRAVELAQEVHALEDLLEEATGDLESKDDEIDRLERSLKKASRTSSKAASAKSKAADLLARRLRTLYKTIEVDDRAIDDISALGDESLRLKAEESVKRLADDAENVAVRRKVGGLPDYVQVYELGFAGKGRIYYTKGKTRRFRILAVGAKNTQDSDLDYLSRLPREDFA
jgi:peptidoglycan hydrolase CwlO-like protein